ncbi:M48 family metalloprotease [Marinivivus vitaminiproducens]|uniref:M48 family metalloprotease n=1 Tax=Marinivivus vitaminiproducens TaxID=3035935 RepID=UPI003FA17ED2
MAERAGLLRTPELYLLPSGSLQAMASGTRERSSVAVTLDLVLILPPCEIVAVLAHEIAHIRHGDIGVLHLAATAASLTRIISTVGMLLLIVWYPFLLGTGIILSSVASVGWWSRRRSAIS